MVMLVIGLRHLDDARSAARWIRVPAMTAPQDFAPTTYFPAQYVNQGKSVEEHIQAF